MAKLSIRAALLAGGLLSVVPVEVGSVVAQPPKSQPGGGGASETARWLAEAKQVLVRDLEAWAGFAFHRQVVRRKLDREGRVTWMAQYDFEVTPADGGFVEELLLIDGRPPTRREAHEHRRAARFEKHYLEAGRLSNPFGSDIPLEELLFDQEYAYAGEDEVRGHPCHRLRCEPRVVPPGLPLRDELGYSMRGSLCLSVVGSHLVEVDLESARVVSAGAATMRELILEIEGEEHEPGLWLPRRFEMRSDLQLGPKHVGRWNRYLYSDYRRWIRSGG